MNETDIERLSGAVYKGVISCDFTLPTVMNSDGGAKTDFKNRKYYIFMATGVNNREPDGPGKRFAEFATLSSSCS